MTEEATATEAKYDDKDTKDVRDERHALIHITS
jgi:hypothetical protein